MKEKRQCKKCNKIKFLNIVNFPTTIGRDNKTVYFRWGCRECARKEAIKHRENNLEKYKKNFKNWNKKNPNYKAQYKIKNKEKLRNYTREYEKRNYVKLRKSMSNSIRKCLKNIKSQKNKELLKILSYSSQDLKKHLESLFEPWMNWDNWGIYNSKTWDDNDSKTWTWQIDHIIPIANFDFKSEDDEEFKKAWSLKNLRPYSAKNNIIEGANKIRHKKIKNKL